MKKGVLIHNMTPLASPRSLSDSLCRLATGGRMIKDSFRVRKGNKKTVFGMVY
jgi:hypothetical protein